MSNHPYNNIMREFYRPLNMLRIQNLTNDVPIIVGATASPIMDSKKTERKAIFEELLNLSANLDAFYL